MSGCMKVIAASERKQNSARWGSRHPRGAAGSSSPARSPSCSSRLARPTASRRSSRRGNRPLARLAAISRSPSRSPSRYSICSARSAGRWPIGSAPAPPAFSAWSSAGAGLMFAAAATALWQVYVGFGFGLGIGVGFSYVPSIAAVQLWYRAPPRLRLRYRRVRHRFGTC